MIDIPRYTIAKYSSVTKKALSNPEKIYRFFDKSGKRIGTTEIQKTYSNNKTVKSLTTKALSGGRHVSQTRMEYADGTIIAHTTKTSPNGDAFESFVRKNPNGCIKYSIIKNGENFSAYENKHVQYINNTSKDLTYILKANPQNTGFQKVIGQFNGKTYEVRPQPTQDAISNIMKTSNYNFESLG